MPARTQVRNPKRIYNISAIESWFSRLTENWEPLFQSSSLEKGRRFYREGVIREVELAENDAIIHGRLDGQECYAVIEWESRHPITRSSLNEPMTGEALAIAGLYEIEEMVAGEITPAPAEKNNESMTSAVADIGVAEPDAPPASAPVKVLLLDFSVSVRGLSFRAFRVDESQGGARYPAPINGSNGGLPLSFAEREALIRLTLLARRHHFTINSDFDCYELTEVERIPAFLNHDIDGWRRYFHVELSLQAASLSEGIRGVDVRVRAGVNAEGNLDLEWIFRSGDTLLTGEDVERLLSRDGKPILVPGIGLLDINNETAAAVRAWRRRGCNGSRDEATGDRPYLLFSLFTEKRVKVEAAPELQAWAQKVAQPAAPIQGLPLFLRKYQRQGVQWLAHLCDLRCHGLLADEMGLGKTLQALSLIARRPVEGAMHLVVAPASVIPVWRREIERFFPDLQARALRAGYNFVENAAPGVWLASYAQLRRNASLLEKASFGYAILDEGQFIKNPDAKVTRVCFSIRARHRIVLTGTPLENRQLDLWSIFEFLMPSFLGSRAAFEAAFQQDRDRFLRKLREQVAPFVLRRTKKLVATELPEKIDMTLSAPLSELQRLEYARICREGLSRLGDDLGATFRGRSFGLFSLLTRLRQVSCDPGLLPWRSASWEESGKINLLLENLGSIFEGGHKVVIFSQFVAFLRRVESALDSRFPDIRRFQLTGASVDRDGPVARFQAHEGAAAMLVSLRAGGTGITLHAADYVFLLDPWWNPAVEEQAIDRVHRIGQKKPVFVYRIVAEGTVEEKLQELKERKKELFRAVVGGMDVVFDLQKNFRSLRSLIELNNREGE